MTSSKDKYDGLGVFYEASLFHNDKNYLVVPAGYNVSEAGKFASRVDAAIIAGSFVNRGFGLGIGLGVMTEGFWPGHSQDLQRGKGWGIPAKETAIIKNINTNKKTKTDRDLAGPFWMDRGDALNFDLGAKNGGPSFGSDFTALYHSILEIGHRGLGSIAPVRRADETTKKTGAGQDHSMPGDTGPITGSRFHAGVTGERWPRRAMVAMAAEAAGRFLGMGGGVMADPVFQQTINGGVTRVWRAPAEGAPGGANLAPHAGGIGDWVSGGVVDGDGVTGFVGLAGGGGVSDLSRARARARARARPRGEMGFVSVPNVATTSEAFGWAAGFGRRDYFGSLAPVGRAFSARAAGGFDGDRHVPGQAGPTGGLEAGVGTPREFGQGREAGRQELRRAVKDLLDREGRLPPAGGAGFDPLISPAWAGLQMPG